jgi:hypothetical protein
MPPVVKRTHKEGCCGNCNTGNIIYGFIEVEDNMIYYPFRCVDCGHMGKEWYNMNYCETITEMIYA